MEEILTFLYAVYCHSITCGWYLSATSLECFAVWIQGEEIRRGFSFPPEIVRLSETALLAHVSVRVSVGLTLILAST